MRSPLRRTLFLLAGVALLGAACSDGGSPTDAAPGKDEARVGFSLDVAGTSVSAISVEVTAPDITGRLVFNIEVVNGVATGSITIPSGADRTITARAYDAQGILTHQGSKVVTVKGGTNTSITITMVPSAGEQPLTINFGALIVQVSRATAPPSYPVFTGEEVGDTARYKAVVRNADGTTVNGKVRWASLNPAIATVDSLGLVTARRPGTVEIAATYQGAGGSANVTVRGDGTEGSADQTAPRLTGLTFGADSVNIAAGDTVLNITVNATDAGSGVSYLSVGLNSPAIGGQMNRHYQTCYTSGPGDYSTPPAPNKTVSWTCRIVFSPHQAGGTWTISSVQLYDRGNNGRFVSEAQLVAGGMRTTVKVGNTNADLAGPAATGISIAPDSLNVTTATDTSVTITVAASDAGAGVEAISVSVRDASGSLTRFCNMDRYQLPGSTATNQVTWSCKLFFQRTSAASTYTISSVNLRDRVGNTRSYTGEQVAATAGWESRFKVAK
ncbi:MAG TPA: Ig-like domain-containing protein [Longimicrobium sp.]